uniref:NPHP4 C2-like domain-containing protein n=1 Tax=Panagrolaimus davidi TaxID=227884 RepID=A0A914QAF4_9BILA
MQVKRYQLYTGSSTLLYYITSLNPADTTLNKISAVIEASLQSHENLKTALNFIPEFLFIPQHEKIPGLKRLEEGVALVRKDIPLLAYPQEADFFAGILDNISISFGVLPEQIDSMFLDLLNKENCFNLNKSPADKNVQKLEVIERRLRIGIHNGYTFVEEPLVLYLTSRDDMESKTHSLRKRSRSLSRLSNFLKTEFGTLQARNSIKLTKLIADPGIAVVFALDYLIGVKQNLDTVTDSHLIMLCWGAWCPYIDESFTISDTITVPLIGGPRPNPDEILCFKNLLRLRQKENDPFNDGKPRISLKFNFAMVGSTDPQVLQKIPQQLDNFLHVPERTISNLTPSPKPDIPVVQVPKGVLEDIGNSEIRHNPFDQTRITVVDVKKEYEAAELVPSQTRPYQKSRYGLESERTAMDLEAVPDMYLTKPTTFTHQINNYISSIQFPQILDRNGSAPTFVDPSGNQLLSLETELKDRLEMNEIIIQFIAILPLKNSYITSNSRISRYFFTLQFYRFQTVTTERLVAHPGTEWKSSLPIILKRIDENNKVLEQNGNGFMIKFLVDKYSITNETDFFNYLNNYSLSIDVWNADSFVHVGTSRIPLKFLCRQSSEAVQTNLQCPIVQSSLPQEEAVTAFLYLKMANIGHPLNPQIDAFQSKNTSAIVSHRMRRLGESQFNSLKIRARPLGAIHESALQRFLTAQK